MAVTVARIQRLVKFWQARLHLSDWRIRVRVGEFEDEGRFGRLSAANVSRPAYLEADIYVDPDRVVAAEEDLRHLICHEVLHCHTAELVAIADLWAGDDVGRKEFVRTVHERLVTRLERVLADVAPE
jgi:hypothetical protein